MKSIRFFPAALLVMVFVLSGQSAAHRVNVFAWIEGDTVHVTGKFAGGGKISGGTVEVYDSRDNLLFEGKTDEQGRFSFPVPEISELKIRISAGPGHQGEWILSEKEVKAGSGESSSPEQTETAGEKDAKDRRKSGIDESENGAEKYTGRDIEAVVDQAVKRAVDETFEERLDHVLERKLEPVMRTLSEMKNPGPTATDIFGGIGYIVGLFGIAAYIYSRRS